MKTYENIGFKTIFDNHTYNILNLFYNYLYFYGFPIFEKFVSQRLKKFKVKFYI